MIDEEIPRRKQPLSSITIEEASLLLFTAAMLSTERPKPGTSIETNKIQATVNAILDLMEGTGLFDKNVWEEVEGVMVYKVWKYPVLLQKLRKRGDGSFIWSVSVKFEDGVVAPQCDISARDFKEASIKVLKLIEEGFKMSE